MTKITVTTPNAGKRFDKYLKNLLPMSGSGFIYKMLRKKNITLNGSKASGNEILKGGDVICLFLSDETYSKMRGDTDSDEMNLYSSVLYDHVEVIFEDDEMLVLNKPIGILSQKSIADDISLNEEVLSYLIHSQKLTNEDLRSYKPSVVNRLDRNTTGLILAAKTYNTARYLSEALAQKECRKFYRCMVKGKIKEGVSQKAYLTKDKSTNTVNIYDEPIEGSKVIETAYCPISYYNDMTYMDIELLTGRSHQIRAHMAHIGHPVVGDPKYGDRAFNRQMAEKYGIGRQLLHSYRLLMPDGREFTAPIPNDMVQFIGNL